MTAPSQRRPDDVRQAHQHRQGRRDHRPGPVGCRAELSGQHRDRPGPDVLRLDHRGQPDQCRRWLLLPHRPAGQAPGTRARASSSRGDDHSKVAIIARNDDYGKGFSELLGTALEDSGAEVIDDVLYNPEAPTSTPTSRRSSTPHPDAVAVIGFNDDGAKIVTALIGQGAGPADSRSTPRTACRARSFAETVDPADPSKVAGIKGTAPAASPSGVESPFTAEFASHGHRHDLLVVLLRLHDLMALAAQAGGTDPVRRSPPASRRTSRGTTTATTTQRASSSSRRARRSTIGVPRTPSTSGTGWSPARASTRCGRTAPTARTRTWTSRRSRSPDPMGQGPGRFACTDLDRSEGSGSSGPLVRVRSARPAPIGD